MKEFFKNEKSLQAKVQKVKNLLECHIVDLHKNHHQLSPSVLGSLYQMGLLNDNSPNLNMMLLSCIVQTIEKSDRVMILFDIREAEGKCSLNVKFLSLGNLKWEDALEGVSGVKNGVCINFMFNEDFANSNWYLIYEDKIKSLAA